MSHYLIDKTNFSTWLIDICIYTYTYIRRAFLKSLKTVLVFFVY